MQKYRVEIDKCGTIYWYKFGTNLLHRLDGPAIEFADGTKSWWQNDKLHREDGPAAEYPEGTKEWWQNGKFHREDGPAVEYSNGIKEYWIKGKKLTEEEFNSRMNPDTCEDKIVEIDGIKYQLKKV